MRCESSRFRATLLLVSMILLPTLSSAQDNNHKHDGDKDAPQQRPPKPIEPPHRPTQQGVRLTATLGLSLIQNSRYGYDTTVTSTDGSTLAYNGNQRASGGTLSLGFAVTPSGAWRRFTLGCDLNFGGVDGSSRPVVPSGTVTPFSQSNLNTQVGQKSLTSNRLAPFVSPYIEHELGAIFQNRIRFGYQYWRTTWSYSGAFAADQTHTTLLNYKVRFSQTQHMVRLSVHNDTWLDDTEPDQVPPRRRTGLVQQGGILIGVNGSVTFFVNVGPIWTF